MRRPSLYSSPRASPEERAHLRELSARVAGDVRALAQKELFFFPPSASLGHASAAQPALQAEEAARRAIDKKLREQLTRFGIIEPNTDPWDAATHLYSAALSLECGQVDQNIVAEFVRSLIPNTTQQQMFDGAPTDSLSSFAAIARRYLATRGIDATAINTAVYRDSNRRKDESIQQHATRFGMLARLATIGHDAALDQYRRAVAHDAGWIAERLTRKEAEPPVNPAPTIGSISILVAQLEAEVAREHEIRRRYSQSSVNAATMPTSNEANQRKQTNKRGRDASSDASSDSQP